MSSKRQNTPETLCKIPDLVGALRHLIAQIPAGRVTTCGDLAAALGNRIAARWVGHFALHHEHDTACTCHRVIRACGQLGQYIDGQKAKARLLRTEGVAVRGTLVDLARYGYSQFASDHPLERLREVQEALLAKVSLRPRKRVPKLVGGVDVSYPRPGEGVAAYALVEVESARLVWSTTVRRRVDFPYISTYLAFRELPILLDLLTAVRAADKLCQVVLVDGSGVLHHRHAGIATHLGVVASVATIGVTKKLLCGEVDIEQMAAMESRPVVLDDNLIGVALRATSGSRRPIFISPGHRLDLAYAEALVRRVMAGHRLPEPLYWADRISGQQGSV